MDDRRLEELLRSMPGDDSPETLPADLADRIRSRHARRARRRQVAWGGAMSAALVVVGWAVLRVPEEALPERLPTSVAGSEQDLREELRQMHARLDAIERELDALAAETFETIEPAEPIEDEDELALRLLLVTAQFPRSEPSATRDLAYSGVVTLFPNTVWAEVARQRMGM